MSSSGAPSEPNPIVAQALALAVQDAVVYLRRLETIVAVAAGVALERDVSPSRVTAESAAHAAPATLEAAHKLVAAAAVHLTTLCEACAKYGAPKQ
jgi:hypothetical protein